VFAQLFIHKNLNAFVVGPGAVGQARLQLAGAKGADVRIQRAFVHDLPHQCKSLFA
jgi:NADH/NAD ratio-sensing transcriptional regulator Rex